MLCANVSGYDKFVGPIIVVVASIDAVSFQVKANHKEFSPSWRQRRKAVEESAVTYRVNYIFPDELEGSRKVKKVSKAIERLAIIMQFYTQADRVYAPGYLPTPGKLFEDLKSSPELRLTKYIADTLRRPYVLKAHQAHPIYEFQKNDGGLDRQHILNLLRHGPTRYHHSLYPQLFVNSIRRMIRKRRIDYLRPVRPFLYQGPRWWKRQFDKPFPDYFKERDRRHLDEVLYGVGCSLKLNQTPDQKHPPSFQRWVLENAPEGWEHLYDPETRS
ncbi:MAG: hypothetical protein ABEK59_07435 [Halobacteria archaeon]